jgi:acetoin utilization deacetylase AcuC-like enzyme
MFTNGLEEACCRSRPEFILISAGFDAYRGDQLCGHDLAVTDFGRLTDLVVRQAEATAQGRVLSMLEGGYGGAGLARCVAEHLRRLGRFDETPDGVPDP